MTDTPKKRAFVARAFTDRGTGESFEAGATPLLDAGVYANYEAAGLLGTPPAAKKAAEKPKASAKAKATRKPKAKAKAPATATGQASAAKSSSMGSLAAPPSVAEVAATNAANMAVAARTASDT